MGTSRIDDRTARERLQEALKHNKHMVHAVEMSDQAFQKAMKDIENMRAENLSLKNQLEAQQKNNELIAGQLNSGNTGPLQDRVKELIGFCRKHGIDPDTGEKKE